MPVTNRGKLRILQYALQARTQPADWKAILVTDTPTEATNVLSDLTEVANGNGYTTGGIAIANTTSGWDVSSEDDTDNYAEIQMIDAVWTASGGDIPASGDNPRYIVVCNDEADPEVIAYHEVFATPQKILSGLSLTVADFFIRMGGDLSDTPTQHEEGNADITAGSGTKGSWVELIASTAFAANEILVTLETSNTQTGVFDLDIATGAASSEVVILPDLHIENNASSSEGVIVWRFRRSIAAGTRIAARLQDDSGTATLRVQVVIGG